MHPSDRKKRHNEHIKNTYFKNFPYVCLIVTNSENSADKITKWMNINRLTIDIDWDYEYAGDDIGPHMWFAFKDESSLLAFSLTFSVSVSYDL